MRSVRATLGLSLLLVAAVALAMPATAQQPAPAAPAAAPKPKPARAAKPKPAPAAAPAAPETPAPAAESAQPTLLGMFGDWGAYTASPGGKKICFALAKPSKSETSPNRPRGVAYLFVSSRPEERVKDEVSVLIGYPFKVNSEASAEVGSSSFALYTQQDGAWVKNAAEEAPMVAAMRGGTSIVIKGVSQRSTSSVDTFTLKGLAEAIDRADQECH